MRKDRFSNARGNVTESAGCDVRVGVRVSGYQTSGLESNGEKRLHYEHVKNECLSTCRPATRRDIETIRTEAMSVERG